MYKPQVVYPQTLRRAHSDPNPKDATTNPTLLLAAANKPQYAHLVDCAIQYGKHQGGTIQDQACSAMDRLVSLCYMYDMDTLTETFHDPDSWLPLARRFWGLSLVEFQQRLMPVSRLIPKQRRKRWVNNPTHLFLS